MEKLKVWLFDNNGVKDWVIAPSAEGAKDLIEHAGMDRPDIEPVALDDNTMLTISSKQKTCAEWVESEGASCLATNELI